MITIKIFVSHKRSLKNVYTLLIKKPFSNCQATYQKELYLMFKKSGNFFSQNEHRGRFEPPQSPCSFSFAF